MPRWKPARSSWRSSAAFDHIVTISAKDGTGCDELFAMLKPYGNEGPHYFDDDAFTDMPEKELVAELVREKALLSCVRRLPHGIAVVVERLKSAPTRISSTLMWTSTVSARAIRA